jgi:hypothetical protein
MRSGCGDSHASPIVVSPRLPSLNPGKTKSRSASTANTLAGDAKTAAPEMTKTVNETKQAADHPRSTASLKRKATAASLGVLLGAFAVVAASAQQSPNAAPVAATSTPVATAAVTNSDWTPMSEDVPQSATSALSPSPITAAAPTTQSHARTRQS